MADNWEGWSPKAGATSQSTVIRLISSAGAGVTGKLATNLTASYLRQAGTRTAISLSDLAAVNSAYSSGGVKEIDATNFPGLYRLDLPDAAIATGVEWVVIGVVCSGAVDYMEKMILKASVVADAITSLNTLLARIVGTLLTGNHSPQSGDAYARVGANGAGLTALGDTRLANLDATVASRLASASYTAPDNVGIAAIGVIVAAIKTVTDKFLFDASNFVKSAAQSLVGYAAAPTVGQIDTQLSTTHGAGTWGAGGNGGALTLTYTLTSSVDSMAIQGATVELYAEVGMVTLIDSQVTNALGQVTFSNLVAGTYYLKRIKSGWSFGNPDSETVS